MNIGRSLTHFIDGQFNREHSTLSFTIWLSPYESFMQTHHSFRYVETEATTSTILIKKIWIKYLN